MPHTKRSLIANLIILELVHHGRRALMAVIGGWLHWLPQAFVLVSVRLLSTIVRQIVCPAIFGRAAASTFLSNRYVKMRKELHSAHCHNERGRLFRAVFLQCCILIFDFRGYTSDLSRMKVLLLLGCAFLSAMPRLRDLPVLFRSEPQTKMWQVSYGAFHCVDAAEDCPEHGVCGICLDNMCSSAASVCSQRSVSYRSKAGLSYCRARGSVAMPGLSAARYCLSDAGSMAGRVATLRCGHVFHAACLEEAWKLRRECPTCRCSMEVQGPRQRYEILDALSYHEHIHLSLHVTSCVLGHWPWTSLIAFVIGHMLDPLSDNDPLGALGGFLGVFGVGVGLAEVT